MEKNRYTVSIYSENNVGLLNRISGIFLKRHINIESLNVSKSEIENVSKFTVVIFTDHETARKIVGQIEKQIEVIKAYFHLDDETIYQESVLFKIDSSLLFDERNIQNIIKDCNATIVTVTRDFFVLAKTGRKFEVDEMYDQLKPFGIMQFVRSGRIAVTKAEMPISVLLAEFKENK
jgi:acetolactate synthase-1/3 small subunit